MKFERYAGNPILKPNGNAWENLCVLNPGVVINKKTGKVEMLYRAAGNDFEHYIRFGLAESDDGVHFNRVSEKPAMDVNAEYSDGRSEDRRNRRNLLHNLCGQAVCSRQILDTGGF